MPKIVQYKDLKDNELRYFYKEGLFFDDLEEFFSNFDSIDNIPREVYGTYLAKLSLEARGLLESAYEAADIDPEEVPGDKVQNLQELLDNWVKDNPTGWYVPDYGHVIDISEEVKEWEQSLHSSE